MDGHLEMFFFPLNHKPNDFPGLRRGKLNALCTPFLNQTVSLHIPLKIILRNRNSGSFLFENMFSITFCFDKWAKYRYFPCWIETKIADSDKTCTINQWLEFYSTESQFLNTRMLSIVFETMNSSLLAGSGVKLNGMSSSNSIYLTDPCNTKLSRD